MKIKKYSQTSLKKISPIKLDLINSLKLEKYLNKNKRKLKRYEKESKFNTN